jgi:hypothetical protein
MTTILRLSITNIFVKGDYCLTLHLGSNKSSVNLILDTGNSNLLAKNYSDQAENDYSLVTPHSTRSKAWYWRMEWSSYLYLY